jgi:predicted DNA-binding transcriptional regulator AlpA
MSFTEILNRDRARRNKKHAERNRKRRQKAAAAQPGLDPAEQQQQQAQQQHDEREQEAEASPLPRFVRYHHLQDAGITDSWKTLYRLIDEYGFPPGIFISPNVRAWNVDDVERWLAGRPTERKAVPSRWHRDGKPESTGAI